MKTTPLPETPSKPERRHTLRRKFSGKIEIEWGSALLEGIVRDIGPSGLFIELTPPLWLGARFVGRLAVQPPLDLDCTVMRVEPEKGMAVSFSIRQESGKTQLADLLAALPSP
jgi:PilZ domain